MRFRTEAIAPPPILELMESAMAHLRSPDFLNLGQGSSGHIPPHDALVRVTEQMSHPSLHGYTPDQGLLELREELSLYLRRVYRIDADPLSEIVITAGGNQAFAGTVLTLLNPGDEVIVPTPFYFNEVMAIQLTGGVVCSVPVASDFQIRVDAIERAITDRTKAIVLISPNNPTGAVYAQKQVDAIVDLCLEHDTMLISDEAYARLVFDGASHYSPRTRRDAEEHVITLGSFSKDFGMAGWRVGFIVASAKFVQEYLKVQDTVTICAPTAGQVLALETLRCGTEYVDNEMERLSHLRDLAYKRIDEIDQFEAVRTHGTFYLFPSVKGCSNSRKLVLDILNEASILVLPGVIFGEAGEGHLRLSIGPLTPDAIDEAFDRLSSFFEKH